MLEYVEAPRCDETLPPNGGKPDEVIDDTIPESYVLRKAESELDLREAELREFLDGKLGGSPP